MNKIKFFILILCGIILQNCNTYKRSFGKTYTTIQTRYDNNLFRLDLRNQDLSEAHSKLTVLTELRMLNLSGSRLLDLDEILKTLPSPEKLEVLILDSLSLEAVPESILRFTNLKHLSLNCNPIIDLEKTITLIRSLPIEFLNLQDNRLVTIPSEVIDIQSLVAINLSYNQISDPEVFRFLAGLPKLKSLWLTHNGLYKLPKEIGLLTSVNYLYLEHNNLSSLPNAMENLDKVKVLHIGHNQFTQLPVQLTEMRRLILLHINNCEIAEIPDDYAKSKFSIKGIILDNNRLSISDKKYWSKEFSSFFMASFE